jgi:hypothetical protein
VNGTAAPIEAIETIAVWLESDDEAAVSSLMSFASSATEAWSEEHMNFWPASIYPLIIQRKNSEDARLILGKAAIRRQVACPKPIDDKGFSLFLGSVMIHL